MTAVTTDKITNVKNCFVRDSSPIAVVIYHTNPENYSKSTFLQKMIARKSFSVVWKTWKQLL
jgi:hypothetical protein